LFRSANSDAAIELGDAVDIWEGCLPFVCGGDLATWLAEDLFE